MAVHRTAATVLVVALALARVAATLDSPVAAITAVVAGVLCLAALTVARFSDGRSTSVIPVPAAAGLSAMAVAMTALAGLSIALSL